MRLDRLAVGVCCCALVSLPALAKSKRASSADATFLTMAAKADMTQANLGQMAKDRGSTTGVKQFGQKLVQDNTEAYRGLQEVAGKNGESIPKGIDIHRNRAADQLMRLKGKRFDRQFVAQEVQDQSRVVAAFKREAQHGHDARIKAFASKMVPVFEGDLHQAQGLARKHS